MSVSLRWSEISLGYGATNISLLPERKAANGSVPPALADGREPTQNDVAFFLCAPHHPLTQVVLTRYNAPTTDDRRPTTDNRQPTTDN